MVRQLFHFVKKFRSTMIFIILWEVVGHLHLVADGALPALSDILIRLWVDKGDYPPHILATIYAAGLGFIIGNVAAIVAGMIFVLSPVALKLFRGVNIMLFALPPIAIAPILVLTLSGMAPRVALAALSVYFVTMTATVTGLTQFDARTSDLIKAYGGNKWTIMRLIQFRGALPSIIAGLQIAAPNAVLGAILAEFGGGGRWGLGAYLLGSLGRGEPDRLWGIGLMATLIAAFGYFAFAWVGKQLLASSRSVTMNVAALTENETNKFRFSNFILLGAMIMMPFLLWWLFVKLTGVPQLVAKTPFGVFDYLFLSKNAAVAQSKLIQAILETLPITFVGMAAGLLFSFLLALSTRIYPQIMRSFTPIAMVTQTMPLVALTPLLVLIFGRGTSLTLWITISVTFFPAYVTLAQGISMIPKSAYDVTRAYGANKWLELKMVTIPASLPYLFAAARLTIPRALLGVMIAQWLATGQGLGNLLNQSRGYLDYGMVWTVASVSVILSVALYQLIVLIEKQTLKAYGMKTAE